MKNLSINEAGKNIIKFYESLRLKTYLDTGKVLTIGYGHTGPDVKLGLTISKEKANELFDSDIDKFQDGVNKLLSYSTNENQFSAMVSLAYNIGLGNFKKSSVLRFHNQGQFEKAANSFLLWNKDNGVVLAGLVKRRKSESLLYLSTDV